MATLLKNTDRFSDALAVFPIAFSPLLFPDFLPTSVSGGFLFKDGQ